jgi:hypothetical protein
MKFGIPEESLDKLLGTISRETRVVSSVVASMRRIL